MKNPAVIIALEVIVSLGLIASVLLGKVPWETAIAAIPFASIAAALNKKSS